MKYILYTILTCFAFSTYGQQDAQYSQFIFNKLSFNPAYAGSKEAMTLAALYRYQWQGIEGAPRTLNVQAHAPFSKNRNGLGLGITGDRIAHTESSLVDLSYAYRIPFKNHSTLSFGLMTRFEYTRFDVTQIDVIHSTDEFVPFDDANQTNVNFGLGTYYAAKSFYVGFSVPTILRNNLYSDQYLGVGGTRNFRSYYFMSGLITPVGENVLFKPAMLISYTRNAPFELDINASFLFMKAFWLGATYRLGDSIDAVFQYQFSKQFKVGIAVDFTLSDLQEYTAGSFEIMIEYLFSYDKEGVNNIRFF